MKLVELIGNTPLIELSHVPINPKVKVFCKLEGQNPGGSVKDRAAYHMIKSALQRGDIQSGDRLVEATSGNTGIALAMVANVLGLHMTLIMPDNSTRERILSMEAYGAKVIRTPAAKTIEYSRELAEEMAEKEGYFMLNQFANPDNYLAHYESTGPEIWRDTEGKVTHFVSAMGTTGTIMGVSMFLKEMNPNVQIVGTQPTDGSNIPGIRRWSPEFLPKIFDASRVDQVIDVSQHEATLMTRRMAKEEGILAGMSSGGALHAAMQLSQNLDEGFIVCITCDRGDRYLSSDLFG
ncbi:cysteine synthase CysM [Cecembia lonarensis]|uniref:Cysteine synthase n=1 Tax=Cecembia lonarensis (strain CCUG 58316 / KCTC 22772 / LW9) TaxID=1225176 RepID=K1LDW0_CECL9|nr:cysteine synthase CysM [Cecembia lonarensis]EKB48588.1 Cysteine synthase B [Cecembia lonarensis LW9]